MTEQERPRTEAGRDALSFLRLDVWRDAILAIEAESRQQAVREAKQQLKDADGPVEFQSAVWYSEVEGILDRVAGLNASETMHDAFCILSPDHDGACDIPGLNASESPPTCRHNAQWIADFTDWVIRAYEQRQRDASESGQPSEARDE